MYMVIKLHFEGVKYEYGIPVNDAVHWIRAFFTLLRWEKINNSIPKQLIDKVKLFLCIFFLLF